MAEYLKLRTPLGNDCEVREVTKPGMDGRRWHVRTKDGEGKQRTFYLWVGRHLPGGLSEERVLLGVLNGVDDELVRDRSMMAPDYEAPLLPQNFE